MAKPQESNLHPRLPESLHHLPVVSRSHTDISQELSLSEKSEDTRSRLNSSSENFPSSDLSEKSLRTSSLIFDSSLPPSALFKSQLKHTSSPSLRIPTCAPSTPSVSPFSPRTSNLLEDFEASDLRRCTDDDYFHDCLMVYMANGIS